MGQRSKTGLSASPTKKNKRLTLSKPKEPMFEPTATPAPIIFKPFAGLYNPYPYGCSLLCNHPTDKEAKDFIKKAKSCWAVDGKNVLLPNEIIEIRHNLEQREKMGRRRKHVAVESVPEELFRRYTDTDSRPLTPAPTSMSAATRASGSRRCVTPDPTPTAKVIEKTLLVLDLRRSHSQETIFYGNSSLDAPIIKIQRVPTRTGSLEEIRIYRSTPKSSLRAPFIKRAKSEKILPKKLIDFVTQEKPVEPKVEKSPEDDEGGMKRRGKRRKKRGRDNSRGPPAFQASIDPETQVGALGTDSHNPSTRPSLVPDSAGTVQVAEKPKLNISKSLDIDSFLDATILKTLRRELNEEIYDSEFNQKRRMALEEALKTISIEKRYNDEILSIQKELHLKKTNTGVWINFPRTFTRSSARFELPIDSRTFASMTPLDYIKENVAVCNKRKLLYNSVFNKYKVEMELESEIDRKIAGFVLQDALDLMMGKKMTLTQKKYIQDLFSWSDDDMFDFKTFCGICAVCERLLAPQYCSQLPSKKEDPCHEVEMADFEALARKLSGKKVDARLVKLLYSIKNL